ncbi:LytR/AlgR family response regulator transcription factor [Maribacter halichondriae]|uniref:LytR/AlgR family response regulator transcription factor n=1 Tax=Maribacter halichondriae TaxID=2980554 RepID=UPI002359FE45|nr:LytTR family DNA-binding domain-containing protein [Maribacter sp. Hal144]
MKVLIIEDEISASENLAYLLGNIDETIEVVEVLDSVKASVAYFGQPRDIDLVFSDIHLADGLSFEIFDQVKIDSPIIFTTAYDQYTLKAFKLNSIDYLLKPIDEEELSASLKQFKGQVKREGLVDDQVTGLLNLIKTQNKTYKTTFLVSLRDELIPLPIDQLAYCYIDTGVVKAKTRNNQIYSLDKKLEDVENELNPEIFCRVNRQFIICKNAISNIKYYFGGKLIVNVLPPFEERIIISKAKAPEFKKWMDS